ncbi:MAG: metallophosphoesterase family protein [Sphingomonas sp.]
MFMRFSPKSSPAIPPGRRVYAIGDVHGEGDLLRRALRLIKADSIARRDGAVTLVFLGDIIDRGADAADLLRTFARMNAEHVVVLKGNHEAALVDAYLGDHEVLSEWLPYGAAATLAGFGITQEEIDSTPATLAAALQARIDPDLIDWLDRLPTAWECGDYYFTHAGVRPGVKLHKQNERDLLWIREPFLSSRRWHGKVVVHGHTVEPGVPSLGGNRIGVDTGAHEHGVLTVLGLEGGRQWLLQSVAEQPEHASILPITEGGSILEDQAPTLDIGTLIAAIVAPEPLPPETALLLKTPSEGSLGLRVLPNRAKGMGSRGVAAAGFALVAAVVGGAIAIGSRPPPNATGNVSLSIPDLSGRQTYSAPAAAAAPSTRYLAGNKSRARPRTSRPASDPTTPDVAAANSADGSSPRLYGAELERALDGDRLATRQLNQDELSRQPSPSPSPLPNR